MVATPPDKVRSSVVLPPRYWRYTLQALILGLVLIAALSALLLWRVEDAPATFVIGEPSPVDHFASKQITYDSEIATELERTRAANAVQPIYTAPDPEIMQRQLSRARDIFAFMTTVRNDPYIFLPERIARIQKIPELREQQAVIRTALEFDEQTWQALITTTLNVMAEIMQEGIRENQLSSVDTRLQRLLNPAVLPSEQEKVIVGIASSLIKPTSFYDEAATAEAKKKAREKVPTVSRTIYKGQVILRAGDIVTENDIEELKALGMLREQRDWREIASVLLFTTILVALPGVFLQTLRTGFWVHWRRWLLICLAMILAVILAKIMIPNQVLMPYLYPMAAISMLLTILVEDPALAILLTTMLSLAVGFVAKGSLELIVLTLVSGTMGALSILRRERLSAFIRAGIIIALANIFVSVTFRLYAQDYDLRSLVELAAAGLVNGLLSASVTFAAFTWVGRLFGITTSLQLMDLARPTQPLLKQLALQAPGTYHHSIIVANMAEQAAIAIGADSLLARIGAYYHDIGKTLRPYFFIENTTEKENIHSRLDPKTSAQIIISHVQDGLNLARKHKLPPGIQDIIAQHHGATLVRYFYEQASEEEQADEAEFRYPGPKPQTREAAIVMLADVEAAVRSARPSSLEETEQLVRQFINARLVDGQLDECNLTLRDLDQIRVAFVSVLKGVFHPRIQYPAAPPERNRTTIRIPPLGDELQQER